MKYLPPVLVMLLVAALLWQFVGVPSADTVPPQPKPSPVVPPTPPKPMPQPDGKVLDIKASEFDEVVLRGKGLILVKFSSKHCGPCQRFVPHVIEYAKKMAGKVKVVAVEAMGNQELFSKYGVDAVPTVIVFRDGKELGRKSGVMSSSQLQRFVDSVD